MSPTTREVAAKKAERQRREGDALLDAPSVEVNAKKNDLPEWAGEELVYCENGPRAGAWYFLNLGQGSWTELRRLARVNGESEHAGRTLGYVPTNEREEHRRWSQLHGRVMLWSPKLAAEAAAKAAELRARGGTGEAGS